MKDALRFAGADRILSLPTWMARCTLLDVYRSVFDERRKPKELRWHCMILPIDRVKYRRAFLSFDAVTNPASSRGSCTDVGANSRGPRVEISWGGYPDPVDGFM